METISHDGADNLIRPLLHELDRIAGAVESRRAAEDRVVIEELTREVSQLRAAVAHLRAAATPLPRRLQRVVARAVVAAEQPAS
jgi:hypothetical protein